MKIRVLVIGIGTGNLDHLTGEAVAALNEVDLFLVADKGPAKRDLAALRTTICQTFIEHDYRLIEVPDPERDRSPGDYSRAVRDWHAARTQAYAAIVHQHLPAGGTLGFLVWGDPAFYDSSIRMAKGLSDHGIDVELRVVPGHQQPAAPGRSAPDCTQPDRWIHPRDDRPPVDRGVFAGSG